MGGLDSVYFLPGLVMGLVVFWIRAEMALRASRLPSWPREAALMLAITVLGGLAWWWLMKDLVVTLR